MAHIIRSTRGALAALVLAGASCAVFAQAPAAPAADGKWAAAHPRRAEVNARLANQNRRINKEVREGEISPAKAAQLHRQDHRVRSEERTMASTNGGHITRAEQRALNQQESQISHEIGR